MIQWDSRQWIRTLGGASRSASCIPYMVFASQNGMRQIGLQLWLVCDHGGICEVAAGLPQMCSRRARPQN
eukprot:12935321-Prorocentrum_lima.AAC.1